jgi:hypothetical protein
LSTDIHGIYIIMELISQRSIDGVTGIASKS